MLNLDTHILVSAFEDRLKPAEARLLAQAAWGISAIVLWELDMLFGRGRIAFDLGNPAHARRLRPVRVWPLDLDVCVARRSLDFRSDPADEIIAATSIVYGHPLLTRDARIRGSRIVPLATA